MTQFGEFTMAIGGIIAALAGLGLLRLQTPFARFHAAGKASPVAFIVTAIGASILLGPKGAALLLVAAAAMTLTLPLGVHLLFRAAHRSGEYRDLRIDELANREKSAD